MTRVVVANERDVLRVEALVFEEDTGLVLSADLQLKVYDEHPIRLMTSLLEMESQVPGSVLVKGKNPYRMFAIVHDLDQVESCQEAWITSAVEQTLAICDELGIGSIAMQMLGTRHGPFTEAWFKARFNLLLKRDAPKSLERVFLLSQLASVIPLKKDQLAT